MLGGGGMMGCRGMLGGGDAGEWRDGWMDARRWRDDGRKDARRDDARRDERDGRRDGRNERGDDEHGGIQQQWPPGRM
jgi:hypothetical protein